MCKDTPTLPLLQILMDIKTKKANLVAIPHYFDTLFALRKPPKKLREVLLTDRTFLSRAEKTDSTIAKTIAEPYLDASVNFYWTAKNNYLSK